MINYQDRINNVMRQLPPPVTTKFFQAASTMKDCIILGIGEPDFKTPWRIREAGIQSLEKGKTWYTDGNGMEKLKQAICAYQKRRFKLDYTPEEIMVTVGGSEGIDIFFRTVLNPGDEVILPTPCYISYDPIAQLCGAK
ncbi:MAG: aminotransferase class I/II-fold pyridoxal phosphate-dependent enzyme, partial [Oscillospiraceae bacterium]